MMTLTFLAGLLAIRRQYRADATKREQNRRTCAGVAKIAELPWAVTALITAWLEVRVLPGPPYNKIKAYLDHWRHWRQQLATDANSGADFAIDEVHCLLDNRRVTLVWGMRRA
jgi:hypothetical protein